MVDMNDDDTSVPNGTPATSDVASAFAGAELPPGAAGDEASTAFRRSDARRSTDQYDMLWDDAGDHRQDAPIIDPNTPRPSVEWDEESSAQRIGSELRRIEAEVRQLLEGRDPKRKRRMAGTRRWHELEEDIIAWRFSARIDDAVLVRLRDLISRRHHLFRRLRFIASTRPTWNS